MIGVLLVTHNGLGDSLVDCVQHVMGRMPPNIGVLSVLASDDLQRKEEEGRALIAQLDTGAGVLILVDLYGSTPCNIARRLLQPGRVEGVSGVNLPMLLRVVCTTNPRPLAEMAQKALAGGQECMISLDTGLESSDVATGCADS